MSSKDGGSTSFTPRYSSLSRISKILIIIVTVGIIYDVVSLWSLSSLPVDLQKIIIDQFEGTEVSSPTSTEILSSFWFPIWLVSVIFFLYWFYNAYENLSSFGTIGLRSTPGRAVIYWFVPIIQLWKPYKAMQEIWKASNPNIHTSNNQEWHRNKRSYTILVWWIIFWLSIFVGLLIAPIMFLISFIGNMIQLTETEVNFDSNNLSSDNLTLITSLVVVRSIESIIPSLLISSILSMIGTIILIFIILDIKTKQEKKYKNMLSS